MFIRYTNSVINFRQHVGYRRLYFKLFISCTERRIAFVDNSLMRQKHLWSDYTGIT